MLTPHLLAFGFAAPALLWGLCLGGAPILIHLLSRRKFRETQWAAMRFLMEAVRKNSRRLQIEQLILLLVRTLLILAVVMALAQPLVEHLGSFFQPNQPVHRILVIDSSFSMGEQVRDIPLFDRAREVARQIVESSRQGDAINLVRLSNIPPAVIIPTPGYQASNIVEEIELMQLPHGRADLAECLEKTADLLKAAPELGQKEVYLISDFQRATWTADSIEEAARLKELLKRLDDASRLVLIDVGDPGASNVAITSLEALDPFATTSRPTRFRVTVHNYGIERVTGRVLEFLVDDRLVEQRNVDMNAGAEATESFLHTFSVGGEHRVQARLQKDSLPLDDQRLMAVPVKERLRVLCVNGRAPARGTGRATDFLELALSPFAPSASIPTSLRGQIEPVVVNEGELQGTDLSQFDCVFLCDVRMFTEREARMLETFLRGGGGVVFCLGGEVRPESYNELLFRDGKGILPAELFELQGDPEKRTEAFAFSPDDYIHPIVSAYQGNPDTGLESTQTYAYLRARLAPDSRSRVALRFDNGDPAIIETPVGTGRSILVTTSVDDRWGLWPLWPSFVPLIHEIVNYSVSGRWGERQYLVGDQLTESFPATAVDVSVAVQRPDGQIQPAHVVPGDPFSQFQFEGTSVSGIYEVTFAHPLARTELFAVNVDPRESNLTKFVPDEIAQELLPGMSYDYLTSWHESAEAPAEAPVPQRGGLTRALIYAVLYLLFTEQMLAWDFRKGLYLLFPPLLAYDWFRGPR